jgi:two-component system, OmpR family, sensor kinase
MSLKARLTIAIVVLLVALTTVLGIVTVRVTQRSMVNQVDDRLQAIRDRPPLRPDLIPSGSSAQRYRDVADYLYAPNGQLLVSHPAGFGDAAEAAPALPPIPSGALSSLIEHPTTLPSTDGSLEYRVLVFRDPNGNIRVMAEAMTDVEDAVSSLTRTFVIAGLLVVLVGAIVSWFVLRRSLRPIEGMVDTASAIAAGDLSKRVDHDDDGTELGRLAGALDDMLTQLEAAFDERAEAQARLERFVGDASHELRTPLTAIRGYAELYRGGGIRDPRQLERAMLRIEQESARMGSLVEDLLLLARLDEQRPLDQAPVDLSALAQDAVADARAVERDRPITLDATGPTFVEGDERRLRQVLANLMTNARVHTPPRTPVHVTVTGAGANVRLVVSDEGPGVDAMDRARIFERFYRTDRSRSRERGGSGLGLSIVNAVVAAHGGTVAVAASDRDHGARFTVELPAAHATSVARAASTDGPRADGAVLASS